MAKEPVRLKAAPYTRAMADKYYRQITAGRTKPVGTASGAPTGDPFAGAMSKGSAEAGKVDHHGGSILEQLSDPKSGIGKIVDILSQPMYAAVENVKDIAVNINKKEYGNAAANLSPLGIFNDFGSQNSKKSVSDALRGDKDLVNDYYQDIGSKKRVTEDSGPIAFRENDTVGGRIVKGLTGFAGDIAGDPLTYIPGGAIKSVLGSVGKAGVKGLTAVADADKFGSKIARDTLKVKGNFAQKLAKPGQTPVSEALAEADAAPVEAMQLPGRPTPLQLDAPPTPIEIGPRVLGPERQIEARPAVERTPEGAIPLPGREPEAMAEDDIMSFLTKPSEDIPAAPAKPEFLEHTRTGEVRPFSSELARRELAGAKRYSPEELGAVGEGLWKPAKATPISPVAHAVEETAPVVTKVPKKTSTTPAKPVDANDEKAVRADQAAFKSWWVSDPEVAATEIPNLVGKARHGALPIKLLASRAAINDEGALMKFIDQSKALSNLPPVEARRRAQEMIFNARQSLDSYRTTHPSAPWREVEPEGAGAQALAAARSAAEPGETAAEAAKRVSDEPGASATPKDAAAVAKGQAEAVAQAQDANATMIRANRGKVFQAWKANAAKILDDEDMTALLAQKTYADFHSTLGALSKKKLPPTKAWQPHIVPLLEAAPVEAQIAEAAATSAPDIAVVGNIFAEASVGIETAKEIQVAASEVVETVEEVAQRLETAVGAHLDPEVIEALKRSGINQLIIPPREGIVPKSQGKDFRYTTPTGVKRTDQKVGKGFGRQTGLNRYWQQETVNALIDHSPEVKAIRAERGAAIKNLEETMPEGKARSIAIANVVSKANARTQKVIVRQMEQIEEAFIARGVWPHASKEAGGVPIRMTQVWKALEESNLGRAILSRVFSTSGKGRIHGTAKNVPISTQTAWSTSVGGASNESLLRIAETIVNMAADPIKASAAEDAIKTIRVESKSIVAQLTNSGEFRTFVHDALHGNIGETAGSGITIWDKANGGFKAVTNPNEVAKIVDLVAHTFTDERIVHSILQSAHINAAAAGKQFADAVEKVSVETYEQILTKLDDTTGYVTSGEKADAVTDVKAEVKATETATKDPIVGPAEVEAAEQVVKENLPEMVPQIDAELADIAKRASEPEIANKPGTDMVVYSQVDNGIEQQTKVRAQAKKEEPEAFIDPDDYDGLEKSMETNTGRILDFMASKFANHYNNATLHGAAILPKISGSVMREIMQGEMRGAELLARKIATATGRTSKEVWKDAYDAIRQGDIAALPTELQEFGGRVNSIMDYMFAVDKADGEPQSILSLFQRSGFSFDHINRVMSKEKYKISEDFRFKMDDPKTTPAELSAQWKQWDVQDPLDFLAKMERVVGDLATETAISREAWRLGVAEGMMSATPRPGWVRVARGREDSTVLRYLPYDKKTGNVYMTKEAWGEIKRMDEILAPRQGGGLTEFAMNYVEPIMSMWKFGMTVARPGHHVRTLIGDISMAFLHSGVKNPKYYVRSAALLKRQQQIMGRTFRDNYGAWDAMAALQGINRMPDKTIQAELARLGGVDGALTAPVAKIKIGGVTHDIPAQLHHTATMDRGVLPNFRQQEDIISDLENADAVTHKIAAATKYKGSTAQGAAKWTSKKLGRFTEGRDDYVRHAHMLHLLENGIGGKPWPKGMTVDDVYDKVAAEVRRAHPDGTDLTPFEKNKMRLAFPFYSWTRKAIPLVVENMLTHPGRFTMYPKAMYDFAQANGVDLNSLSDPFPPDQVFPNFLRENMTGVAFQTGQGTDKSYWTGDIGAVQADVANSFAPTNGGFAGTLRGVAGMLNPAVKMPFELLTGARADTGVKISDRSDYFDQTVPGLNAVNSVTGVSPTGSFSSLLKGNGLDMNAQAAKGVRGGLGENPEYGMNYLFGQKLYDTTKPNLINLGNIDLKNKIAQMAKKNAG